MNNYSELTGINPWLHCYLELEPVGTPEVAVIIDSVYGGGKLFKSAVFDANIDLLKPFEIQIELINKEYHANPQTGVTINRLQIDGIDLIPKFDYLAVYDNDYNNHSPTHHLSFNGKWTLTFDRPFYQWLHQATKQGWLLG
jgi:hypothetical protein